MSVEPEQERRQGPDRRNTPRGGRRPGDIQGFSPLILVADDDANNGAHCVAILARLRFAVAPAHSVDEAIKVMGFLHPTLVVSRLKDLTGLRSQMAIDPTIAGTPIVALTPETDDPQIMLQEIRRVLRTRPSA